MAKPKHPPLPTRFAIFMHQLAIAQKLNRRASRKAELMRGYRLETTTTTTKEAA